MKETVNARFCFIEYWPRISVVLFPNGGGSFALMRAVSVRIYVNGRHIFSLPQLLVSADAISAFSWAIIL